MEKVIGIVISLMFFGVVARINIPLAAQSASEQRSPTPNPPKFTLKTSVNRVLLDVVVTDAKAQPVQGLTKDDFTIEEDGHLQSILSFDVFDFDQGMDYRPPPNLPALPSDTFVNLPARLLIVSGL
ncbi:MAG TPA: hypothetical protein VK638_51965 [Edaphobacter sp.]|nr:hypothetical protein [Edaphobacter sp.]